MILAVLLALSLVLLGTVEGSYRLGRASGRADEIRVSHMITWQSTILALVGLLVGFTFSMAASRFDERRELIVDEANAIGTTYLRAPLLGPVGEELRALLRRYLDVRIAYYDAGADRARIGAMQREGAALQRQMWSRALAVARADPRSTTTPLVLASLNEAIDLAGKRLAALDNHVPPTIFVIVVLAAMTAAAAIGYTCGLIARRIWFGTLVMPVLLAIAVTFLLDLDRPRVGFIHTGQPSMLRLRQSL
jgi:hypothetical protein